MVTDDFESSLHEALRNAGIGASIIPDSAGLHPGYAGCPLFLYDSFSSTNDRFNVTWDTQLLKICLNHSLYNQEKFLRTLENEM